MWFLIADDIWARHQLKDQLAARWEQAKETDKIKKNIALFEAHLPTNPDVSIDIAITREIYRQANCYGVDPAKALAIAKCESSLNPFAKNPLSSAVGVYQWLSGTWEFIGAPGLREDYRENIKQFMIFFPTNPNWWKECLEKI